jgi:hypothetical protein
MDNELSNYNIFGISIENKNWRSLPLKKINFDLYPKEMITIENNITTTSSNQTLPLSSNNISFQNDTFIENIIKFDEKKKFIKLTIDLSWKLNFIGIKIKGITCWNNLINFLKTCSEEEAKLKSTVMKSQQKFSFVALMNIYN